LVVPAARLEVLVDEGDLTFSPCVEAAVDELWAKKQQELPDIFDGTVWALAAFEDASGPSRVALQLNRTSFRYMLFARHLARLQKEPDEEGQKLVESINSIGVGAVVFTAEGKVCLGRRTPSTPVAPGMWCYPGGILDVPDPERLMLRELHEELGVPPDAVTAIKFAGLWDTGELHGWSPCVVFVAQLVVTAQALEEDLWPCASDNSEHTALAFIDAADPCEALRRLEAESGAQVMPFARNVIECYARDALEWLRQA